MAGFVSQETPVNLGRSKRFWNSKDAASGAQSFFTSRLTRNEWLLHRFGLS
jgi:hypothetical protein